MKLTVDIDEQLLKEYIKLIRSKNRMNQKYDYRYSDRFDELHEQFAQSVIDGYYELKHVYSYQDLCRLDLD